MITASLLLVARRTAAHIRLLSAVVIGVVLAVTVMSSSVIYFDALRNIALDRSLAAVEPERLDLFVQGGARPVNRQTQGELEGAINGTIIRQMEPYLSDVQRGLRSWTFFLDEPPPQVLPGQCPCRVPGGPAQPGDDVAAGTIVCDCQRMNFMTIPGFTDNVVITQGRAPQPSTTLPPPGEPMVVEVALDVATAGLFGLTVGDDLRGRIFWSDPNKLVTARLVGIYERANPSLGMWRIYDEAFSNSVSSLEFASFVVPEETILDGLARQFPGMGADSAWVLDTDPSKIAAEDTRAISGGLRMTHNQLRAVLDGYSLRTDLPVVLERFETELFFNRLPMFIVLVLIVLVVLYYVVTLATLLVEAQKSEVALLRSRGATSQQILAVFVIEAALLSALAVLIGPLLAMGAISGIGMLPFYVDLNGGNALPVRLTGATYLLAAIGGVLSMAALFIPAVRASRLGLLTDRRSRTRPPRLAFIQRYYLDLGLLGIVLFLFWQLSKQGSFVATDLFGEESVNNLVLAVPAMFLVAAGIVLLRVFPVAMDLLGRALSSRYGSRLASPSVVLTVWQMARSPASHARLSLLLILTAGLGVFAASFASTLERSATEQALYNTGADLRVPNITSNPGGPSFRVADRLAEADGVLAASSVYRLSGVVLAGFSAEPFDLLAVEGETLPTVAWFRDDFAEGSLSGALEAIETGGQGGLLLPEEGFWLTALIKPLTPQPNTYFVARVSDVNGRYFTVLMGTLLPAAVDNARFSCPQPQANVPPGWCRVGARLGPLPVGRADPLLAQHPVRLHAIGIATFNNGPAAGAIDIDDLSVLNRSEDQLLVVEDFDDLERWRTLEPSDSSLADSLTVATDDDGNELPGIARFRWTAAAPREIRGIAVGREQPVMPVIASPSFMERYDLSVGDSLLVAASSTRMRAVVRGTVDLFPTLMPDDRPFLVADLHNVHELLNLPVLTGEVQPNEVWLRTENGDRIAGNRDGFLLVSDGPDPAVEAVRGEMNVMNIRAGAVLDRSALLAGVAVDPLVSAGWQALLGIAFLTVLVVSAIGFMVHVRVSFNNRRSELALLRTIGLSAPQMVALIVLEQVIVIGTAIGIGLFMGARLGDTIIPFLANSGENSTLVPPMVLQIDWAGFSITFGLLGFVFALVITAVLVSVFRMSIHRVMRMGEG